MLNVWHSWMNAWRWRFGSSLPVKGECCTMRIVEVLISNGLSISVRFKIGRSMMSGVHSSPILHYCGWSTIVGEVAVHLLLGLAINKIYKNENKNKSKKTRVTKTRLDWFWGWLKVSACKNKNQKKTKNYTKSNKRSNLDHLFPSNGARKRGLLTVYNRIKLQVDLQADKSPVVVKGPFFPRVVNPRYRICGTNVWC
jgi:hypothetical protein